MRRYLKKGARRDQGPQDSQRVEDTVRGMLAEIRGQGDAAIRRYAAELDGWSQDVRVGRDQIDKVAARLPETFKEDFTVFLSQALDSGDWAIWIAEEADQVLANMYLQMIH